MIDPSLKLFVFHDDGGAFTDFTNEAVDYLSLPYSLTLTSDDFLYLGLYKPFNASYFEMSTANTNSATMLVEYFDGTDWQTAMSHDDSVALSRSGLISWDKSDMTTTTINSQEAFYVRISLDIASSALEIHGSNIVFSDDAQLKQEFFEIDDPDLLPSGFDSHIPKHVAARNQIMQDLRNKGNIKDDSDNLPDGLVPWDLHDNFQIREAATYLALSKIFFNLSDNVEDHWFRKFEEYRGKYNSALSLYQLDVDFDDDGIKDSSERTRKFKTFRWSR